MIRILSVGAVALFLSGCQSPGFFYEKDSGLRVDANPQLLARYQDDKLQCDADAAREALASREPNIGVHNRLVTLIYHACMAKRGYVVRDA